MPKRARIVIGANLGDCGKGLITDYLCAQGAEVVVRFNGGAQAGHTVCTPDGKRHVFHHFGAGSLLGVPTYLSSFFVCNPLLFFPELKRLNDLGFRPDVYAHPDCLITTFMDMLINQALENKRSGNRHGSCGVGFHETIVRSEIPELKITLRDLWNERWVRRELEPLLIEICRDYARYRTGTSYSDPRAIADFLDACYRFADYVRPRQIGQFKDPVFEGAQGLLLDQDNKEYFPHVTHSSTGMKNVNVLCVEAGIEDKDIYYVSRTYLTRHGAGPLPGYDPAMSFPDDTNMPNEFQGVLRFAPLRLDELVARCNADAQQSYNLVLTHCDQLEAPCRADILSFGPTREDVVCTGALYDYHAHPRH